MAQNEQNDDEEEKWPTLFQHNTIAKTKKKQKQKMCVTDTIEPTHTHACTVLYTPHRNKIEPGISMCK